MPAKFPVKPEPAEKQVERAMDLLELHGATKPVLWYALDEVLTKKDRTIARLESMNKILEERIK